MNNTTIVIGRQENGEPFNINIDSLLKHTIVLGATGSGKTTLCKAIIEELALRGYPIIAIDPKGDIGALAIASPNLNFRPWSDIEAKESGMDPELYAEKLRKLYLNELAKWGITLNRIRSYVENVHVTIYTPRSTVGVPLSIKPSLNPLPNIEQIIAEDKSILYDAIDNTVSLLLKLAGYSDKNTQEHALLSQIIEFHWLQKEELSLETLIQEVINPPFDRIGSLSVEEFIPQRSRLKLARNLNILLSHPMYKSWLEGETIDFDKYFNQRGTISVIDLRFMSTLEEKQFFIGAFLQEFYRWLLRKGGTSKLRLVLYFDELVGFIPPVGKPPSKTGLLLLIKQGRAFGLGCLLATQNPADIDYKILSNAAHRFIGRLATKQDIDKVKRGLNIDENLVETIPRLKPRTFLYHNYETGKTTIVRSRWLMTYHRGPLQPDEIRKLMKKEKKVYKNEPPPLKDLILIKPRITAEEVTRLLEDLGFHVINISETVIRHPYYLVRLSTDFKVKEGKTINYKENLIVVMNRKEPMLIESLRGREPSEVLVRGFVNGNNMSFSKVGRLLQDHEVVRIIHNKLKLKVFYIAPLDRIVFNENELEKLTKEIERKIKSELVKVENELKVKFELHKKELVSSKPLLEAELKLRQSYYNSLSSRIRRLERIRNELRYRKKETEEISKELKELRRELRSLKKKINKLKEELENINKELLLMDSTFKQTLEEVRRKYYSYLKEAIHEIKIHPRIKIVEKGYAGILKYEIKVKYANAFLNLSLNPYSLSLNFGRCSICGSLVIKYLNELNSKDKIPLCNYCGSVLCDAHALRCSFCHTTVCIRHVNFCSVCGRPLCPNHTHKCSVCNTYLCPDHTAFCSICKAALCPSHVVYCSLCGKPLCSHCVIYKRRILWKRPICPNCLGSSKDEDSFTLHVGY